MAFGQSIRFVAYSYATEANFPKRIFSARASATASGWAKAATERAFDFQDNLAALGATRSRVYDDGVNFVLDMAQRRAD